MLKLKRIPSTENAFGKQLAKSPIRFLNKASAFASTTKQYQFDGEYPSMGKIPIQEINSAKNIRFHKSKTRSVLLMNLFLEKCLENKYFSQIFSRD